MDNLTTHILIVVLPLLLSNVVHMFVVKWNLLSFLTKPLWKEGFGANKTWRGFLIVPLLNAFILWLVALAGNLLVSNPLVLGFLLGLAYLLFELPNSYFKRRAGIQPGGAGGKYAFLGTLIDKMDSAFGVVLVYFLLGYIALIPALILFLLASATHFLISYVLVLLKVKKSI